MTEEFISYWENVVNNQPDNSDFSFAQKMVNIPKIVSVKRLQPLQEKTQE